MNAAPVIPVIIDRHAEDAAFLWLLRDAAVAAPNYSLDDLAELDNRLDAHLDGLKVAGEAGWEVSRAALELGEPGEVFVAAVLALSSGEGRRIDAVLEVAHGCPDNLRAFVSALGWLEFPAIQPLAQSFLNANQPVYNYLGIAAHALHRQDPGEVLGGFLASDHLQLRARALKAVGELKRDDLAPALQDYWRAGDDATRFWSSWSAALLGNGDVESMLRAFVRPGSPYCDAALQLVVRMADGESLKSFLAGLARQEDTLRFALIGAGYSGDPLYVPGLLKQMEEEEHARVAGEAFSMITGADLAYLDLDGDWPEGFEAGPTEDPADEDVALDRDEDLPWPNPSAVAGWWKQHGDGFSPAARYLHGELINEFQCRNVLLNGYQRQRHAAALELALMNEAQLLYETRAPGFRQARELITHPGGT